MTESANGAPGAEMTIDELARRTGMTVRNIRAHQSRGLLPPPEVRGRTGFYGDEHASRIELIRELQADGFNLEAIKRLLASVGNSSSAVLDFARAVRAPFEQEAPQIIDAAELAELWKGAGSKDAAAALRRAVELDLLNALGDGRFEVASPTLTRAGAELAVLGVPPEASLEVLEKLRRHARSVSRIFVNVFIENVWEPFDRAGRPEEDWPKIRDAIERLRPLASESLLATFQLAMSDATDKAFERMIEREPDPRKRSRGGRRRR